jgi:5-methylcytosine-specific restriction endonuclease McrA
VIGKCASEAAAELPAAQFGIAMENPYRQKVTRLQEGILKLEQKRQRLIDQFHRKYFSKTSELRMQVDVIQQYIIAGRKYNAMQYYLPDIKGKHSGCKREKCIRDLGSDSDPFDAILDLKTYGHVGLKKLLDMAHPVHNKEHRRNDPNLLSTQLKHKTRLLDEKRASRPIIMKKHHETNVAILKKECEELREKIESEESYREKVQIARNVLRDYLRVWKKVDALDKKINSLNVQRTKELPYLHKHEFAYAKAAAVDEKTRQTAGEIATQIPKTLDCPYCNGPLGDDAHLDHIYPVSKGGLSVLENLVWCCWRCNLRKGNSGLISFAKKHGYDLDQIHERLISLGKNI